MYKERADTGIVGRSWNELFLEHHRAICVFDRCASR